MYNFLDVSVFSVYFDIAFVISMKKLIDLQSAIRFTLGWKNWNKIYGTKHGHSYKKSCR